MIVASQMYAKLFRPWDVSADCKNVDIGSDCATSKDIKPKSKDEVNRHKFWENVHKTSEQRIKKNQTEKANKLRKIRNRMIHQDSTISTTTEETQDAGNQIKNLEEINKRLGYPPSEPHSPNAEKSKKSETISSVYHKKKEELKMSSNSPIGGHHAYPFGYPEHLVHPIEISPYGEQYPSPPPRIPGDLMYQTEFAQSLGISPTDPLLMESFAQGYAMELEYARILHEENQAKILNAKKQRPKKYKCPHCDVGFSNNGQLKGHIRIHTGERPFKCDDKNCGKTFTRNEELTRHRRIHSGLRPYPCPTCGKKFGRRDHLKKHTKTHLAQAERMLPMFVPLSAFPPQYPYLYGY